MPPEDKDKTDRSPKCMWRQEKEVTEIDYILKREWLVWSGSGDGEPWGACESGGRCLFSNTPCTVLQSACSSSWRHRTNCGLGEEEGETILEELPLVLMVPITSVQLSGLKTSLKPPGGALNNIARQARLLLHPEKPSSTSGQNVTQNSSGGLSSDPAGL